MGSKIAHADVARTCITGKRGLLRKMYGYCPTLLRNSRGAVRCVDFRPLSYKI